MVLDEYVMNSRDIPTPHPLADQAFAFARRFAEDGPDFLAAHVPAQFLVGTPSGANLVSRDRFIEAALGRAALVTGEGLPAPSLAGVDCVELGDAYLLITAHWTMPGLDGLVEDFLIDATGPEWTCLAYLLRQNLPGLLAAAPGHSSS